MIESGDVTPKGAIQQENSAKPPNFKHRNTVHLNSAPKNLMVVSIDEKADEPSDDATSSSNKEPVLRIQKVNEDSGSDKDDNFINDDDKEDEPDSGTMKQQEEDKLRFQMRKNLERNQMLLPPPEELIKKKLIENEAARTGAPIPFIKCGRLIGNEKIEKLDPENPARDVPVEPTVTEIPPCTMINDYLIHAKNANRLVYCRFGEKYVTDLEKRKNSNISSLNAPNACLGSASYLINIRKLIEDHNIESEKKDFKSMKTTQMNKKD